MGVNAAQKVRLIDGAAANERAALGIAPSQLFAWKRRMAEGLQGAVAADEDVEGRDLERRVRELERLLGKKRMDVEIFKKALDAARAKCRPCRRVVKVDASW